jgi:hypothetical protein
MPNDLSPRQRFLASGHGDLGRISDKWPIVFQLFDGFVLERQNATFCPPRKCARIGVGRVVLTATVPAKTGNHNIPEDLATRRMGVPIASSGDLSIFM